MVWGLWTSSPAPGDGNGNKSTPKPNTTAAIATPPPDDPAQQKRVVVIPALPPTKKKSISWNESLNATDWEAFKEPRNLVPSVLFVTAVFGFWQFYRSYLRRIPGAGHIAPGLFRTRSLLGKVTSVGDGDGFHLFHTPGGRLAGWGWLRNVPKARKELKGRTISVRIAGVDAPEGAHFGRPSQPFAAEALEFLQSYVLGKRVRAYIYKRDQYERVVASVFVRKPPFFIRKDVGMELVKRGLATTYEAKTGAEFGGPRMEAKYKAAEEVARRKKRGMWSLEKPGLFQFGKKTEFETPKAYKDRMKMQEGAGKKT